MSCIFCTQDSIGTRVEHILPESLGGRAWACLPPGVVCDKCNQYFGAKVESSALGSHPFLPFRLLLGIPTKKGKAAVGASSQGDVASGSAPGQIVLNPRTPQVAEQVEAGEITQLRMLATPLDPLAVCRLLLKMGVETVAAESAASARSRTYDAARQFARAPTRGEHWWYFESCDYEQLGRRFAAGVTADEWRSGVSLEVSELEGEEVFHLRLLELSLIVPLGERLVPAPELSQSEPEWRVYSVSV